MNQPHRTQGDLYVATCKPQACPLAVYAVEGADSDQAWPIRARLGWGVGHPTRGTPSLPMRRRRRRRMGSEGRALVEFLTRHGFVRAT